MATKYYTIRDIASGRLKGGKFDTEVVKALSQTNDILKNIVWTTCNSGRENITTIRCGMPEAVWRMFYQGVPYSKGAKKQVTTACATLSSAMALDKRLYLQEKNRGEEFVAGFYNDEASNHIDEMNVQVAKAIFWGDVADNPKGINGFFKTYSKLCGAATTREESAFTTLDGFQKAGGSNSTAALRSIALVGHGKNAMRCIVPEGAPFGLQRSGLKEAQVPDGDNNLLDVMREVWDWDIGLEIKDVRTCGAIRNIQLDAMDSATAVDLVKLTKKLAIRVVKPSNLLRGTTNAAVTELGKSTLEWHMSPMTFEALADQVDSKLYPNVIKMGDLEQGVPHRLHGIPICVDDVLEVNDAKIA